MDDDGSDDSELSTIGELESRRHEQRRVRLVQSLVEQTIGGNDRRNVVRHAGVVERGRGRDGEVAGEEGIRD